jgi:hypothetical protein
MNVQPRGRLRRWFGRYWRFAARHGGSALLLLAVPIGGAGLALLLAGRPMPAAGVVKVGQIVLVLLLPVLLFGATCYAPFGVQAVQRLVDKRRAEMNPQPSNRPIEQIAADLRRLLWQHDTFARSNDIPMRARRLWALEAAITDCATQAARALDVPHPGRPAHGGFDKPQLRRLLRALAAEGLVLPPAVGLLAPDSRF